MGAVWAGNRGGKGSTSKGSMVCGPSHSRLCAPFPTVSEQEPPGCWRASAHLLALHTRVTGNSSQTSGRQMQRPTVFLSTVDLCLDSWSQRLPRTCPRGRSILPRKKAGPMVAQCPVGTEPDGAGLSLSWFAASLFSPVRLEADMSSLTGDALSLFSPFWATSPRRLTSPPSTSEHDHFKVLLIPADWP